MDSTHKPLDNARDKWRRELQHLERNLSAIDELREKQLLRIADINRKLKAIDAYKHHLSTRKDKR